MDPVLAGGRCVVCGCVLMVPAGQLQICAYHISGMTDWAKENAIWCHFFHRGLEIPRLPKEDR